MGNTVKTFLFALAFSVGVCAQPTQCNFKGGSPFTGTGTGLYNNSRNQCNTWVLTYWSTGFSALSVELDGAADVSGSPGSFTAISTGILVGSNPSTNTTGGTLIVQSPNFFPWLRFNVTSTNGTGTITYQLYGSSGIIARAIPPPNEGPIINPNPPVVQCPNDSTTGTTIGVPVKLNASAQCVSASTNDGQSGATSAPVIGVCFSGCGKTGSANVVTFEPVVACLFDNATTFGHWALLGQSAIGCHDNGSGTISTAAQMTIGIVVSTNASSGVLGSVVLIGAYNPGRWTAIANSVSRLDMGSFNGGFLWRTGGAGAGICHQFGGAGATNPALGDSGNLLKVLESGTNCTAGDGNLGTGHLSSDNASPPTVTSGCGTMPSIVSGGDLAFILNVGTGGVANTCTVTFGKSFTTAPACFAQDSSTNLATMALGGTATVIITTPIAWTASDKLVVICIGQNGL